jgi:hypothetical protein
METSLLPGMGIIFHSPWAYRPTFSHRSSKPNRSRSDGTPGLEDVPVPRIGESRFAPRDVPGEVTCRHNGGSDSHRWRADNSGVKSPPRKVVSGHKIVDVVR